jgi:hypothetical protein
MAVTVNTTSKSSNASISSNTKTNTVSQGDDYLLKEDGGFLLKEDGGKIILEEDDLTSSTKAANATVNTTAKS